MGLVVIEGLSGVGKSTLAPLLAAAIGADFVPSIPSDMAAARRVVDQDSDVEARHFFYLTAMTMTSRRITPMIAAGRNVLLESYYFRAEAFHRAMGSRVAVDLSFLVQPDLTLVLECNEGLRRVRLEQRPASRTSYWHERSEACSAEIRAYYSQVPGACWMDSGGDVSALAAAATVLAKERL